MRSRGKLETAGQAALLLSAVLVSARSSAVETEAVRLEYVAPVGCPDRAAFTTSLRSRTARFRLADSEGHVRRFSIRITKSAATFAGRLEIATPDRGTSVRSVDGPICDELANALALMAALAIDPDAATSVGAPNRDDRATSSSAERDPAKPPPASASPVAVPTQAGPPWRWSAGMQGHAISGITSRMGVGGELFVEADIPSVWKVAPAFRGGLNVDHASVNLASPTTASASFLWLLASVQGCVHRSSEGGGRWGVFPCLSLRLGALRSEGRGISQPNRTVSLWSDLGPLVRVQFAVSRALLVELQGAGLLALTQPSFQILDLVSGTTTTYSTSRFGGVAGIGVAYRFP